MKIVKRSSNEITVSIPLTITISLGELPGTIQPLREQEQEAAAGLARFSLASLASSSFRWDAALSCALASKLAYSGSADVAAWQSGWGLQSIQFLEAVDTQCFVAIASDIVLIAFRGTENVADWIADFNALRVTRPYGKVHRGFYHAFNDVRSSLEAVLAPVRNRRLIVTGHSLGGALATVAAAEWLQDNSFAPAAAFTFGQPRVGDSQVAKFINSSFGDRYSRFVNDDDIVPRVPPGYSHVGKLFHFDAAGELQESLAGHALRRGSRDELRAESTVDSVEPPPLTQAEFDRLRAQLLLQRQGESLVGVNEATAGLVQLDNQFEGFFPSVRDHAIDNYISRIEQHT